MIVTTTQSVEGKIIQEYVGLVSGADTYNAGGLVGGGYTSGGQSLYFQAAIDRATQKMEIKAYGADAIVGVQVVIGASAAMNQVIVTVTGTAVKLRHSADDDALPEL